MTSPNPAPNPSDTTTTRPVLIDTDPHASLSYYFGIDSDELSRSLYDIFIHDGPLDKDAVLDCLCPTKLDSLFILPASMALATLDRKLGNQSGMGLTLKKALGLIEDEFEYALIDCPPVLGVLMVNALAASTRVIIPVQTEFLALKGLERMLGSLHIMQQSLRKEFRYTIVPTMFDKRTRASLNTLEELKATYASRVWSGVIPIDSKYRDARLHHQPVSLYSRNCRGAYAYETLLNYLLQIEIN